MPKTGLPDLYVADFQDGFRVRDIAKRHGVSSGAVSKALLTKGARCKRDFKTDRLVNVGQSLGVISAAGLIIIDRQDSHLVDEYSFSVTAGRPVAMKGGKAVPLGRLILGAPAGAIVDHINGNVFDNRRVNLRECSRKENSRNRKKGTNGKSPFKGVSALASGLFKSSIALDDRVIVIGTFERQVDAALAYDRVARIAFGEFACLNFPSDGERGAL